MWVVGQAFWQILLLRKSPATIPYSDFLLGTALLLQLLLGSGFWIIINRPVAEALSLALLGIGLAVGATYLLLSLYGMRSRFVQTATAIAGCELLLGVIALPINIWLFSVDKANAGPPGMLSLILIGWNVAVVAHIWRHALDVTKALGFLFAIGYVIISTTLYLLIQAPEG